MGASALDRIDGSQLDNDSYFGFDERPPTHKEDGDDGLGLDEKAFDENGVRGTDQLAIQRALAPIPGGGPLLEEKNPRKLFKAIDKEVIRQEPLARNRDEMRKHWEYVRGGASFSILEKNEDLSIYKQIFPPGVDAQPTPVPNKVADLCDKIINQILVDPPLPNPKVDNPEDDRARAAADLTRRFLRANSTPAGTNDLECWRECLNINITQKSAFVFAWVDEKGNGWRPKQIRAHPLATDPSNPFVAPDGSTEGERVLRYVASVPDPERPENPGQTVLQFTRDAAAADRQWMPKLMRRVLPPAMVRVLPKHRTVTTARGVVLLMWDSLSEARRMFPVLDAMPKDKLRAVCAWKPKRWRSLVPEALRAKSGMDIGDESGELSDDTLVFWYHRFNRSDDDYQDGAEIAINGAFGGTLLKRDTLRADVELQDGTKVPVVRDIPVSQFIALQDTRRGDPFGLEPIQKFSGSNEIYAHLWLGILTALEKGLNPLCFLPSTSPVTREDMQRRDGRPIEILSADDKPSWEQAPQLPGFTMNALEQIEDNMQSEAGTNDAANAAPQANRYPSGVSQNVAIRQAKVSLAQYWQNTAAGIVRTWQIYSQLAMCFYTQPQQLMLSGTGAFKQRWWIGSDLNGVSEIVIDSGSFTMMAPGEKLSLLQTLQANQWMPVEQASELARSVQSDDLGLQPDPHKEHIDSQISEWMEGPPPTFQSILDANQQAQQDYQLQVQQLVQSLTAQGIDPQQAQAQAQQQVPQPQLQPLPTCFAPRPNDEEPGVALIRARALSRFMATPEYGSQPKEWQQDVDQAYQTAFMAAGGQTVKMQQAAAMQAAQAAKGDGSLADVTYQEFLANIQRDVMAQAAKAIAKEISGFDGAQAGQQAEANLNASAGDVAKAMSSLTDKREARAHQANENAKDRAHEAHLAHQQHGHRIAEHAVKHGLSLAEHAQTSQAPAPAVPGAPANPAASPPGEFGRQALQPTAPGVTTPG